MKTRTARVVLDTHNRVVGLSDGRGGTIVLLTPTTEPVIGTGTQQEYQKLFTSLLVQNGAKLDGVHDDADAINSALILLKAQMGGGTVELNGTALVGKTINIPNWMTLKGRGKRSASRIIAADGFVGTSVVRLGLPTDTVFFDYRVEDISISCSNIVGLHGVYAILAQEGCGLYRCLITDFAGAAYGVFFDASANFILTDIELYPSNSGADTGVRLFNAAGASILEKITVGVSGLLQYGIFLHGTMSLRGIHAERCTHGVYCDYAIGVITGLTGPTTSSDVTNLVTLSGNTRYMTLTSIVRNTALNTINDAIFGFLKKDAFIPFYLSMPASQTGILLTPIPIAPNAGILSINMALGDYFPCNQLTENITVDAPTNADRGRKLIIGLSQDSVGGRTVTWNQIYKNVTLPASGLAVKRACIEFFFDGFYWHQQSVSPWV